MKDKDMLLLAGVAVAGIMAWKVGTGLGKGIEEAGTGFGLGFAGLGQGIGGGVYQVGQGVSNIGLGVEALGQGVGAGVAYTGAGIYQIGTGTGTFIGGASPANILQAIREHPEYYGLTTITPEYPKPQTNLPEGYAYVPEGYTLEKLPTPDNTPSGTNTTITPTTESTTAKTNTATGGLSNVIKFIKKGWAITPLGIGYKAITSLVTEHIQSPTKPEVPATQQVQVASSAPVQGVTAAASPTTAVTTQTTAAQTVYNPTLQKTLIVPAGATQELLTAMASPYWNPAF